MMKEIKLVEVKNLYFTLMGILLMIAFCYGDLPLPGNGVLNPPLHNQRFRWKEYPSSHPYYQWWYFWIRDYETNQHYAIAYSFATCKGGRHFMSQETQSKVGSNQDKNDCKYDAPYMMFATVDNAEGHQNIAKYMRFSQSDLRIEGEYHYMIHPEKKGDSRYSSFELNPKSDGEYNLYGFMSSNDTEHVWVTQHCDKNLEIEWNLNVSRIYGYYAQDIFEGPDEYLKGVIMWNTYSHDAQVEGTLRIGSKTYHFEKQPRFRAYGDMNWGNIMPIPPPSEPNNTAYAWGWYSVAIPNKDLSKEFSLIAGTGKTYTGFPFYSMDGRFADIRINSTHHLEVRQVLVWDQSPVSQRFYSSNDGHVSKFEVERSNWVDHEDQFGVAHFPLTQVLTIETESYLIVATYNSNVSNYNRLLFPFDTFVFSDFEALGVSVKITITHKPSKSIIIDQDLPTSGGLEYGFKYNVNV